MDIAGVRIRRTVEDDWQDIRRLRLEMLEDTPPAFVETLETALGHDPEEWKFRGRRGSGGDSITLAAIAGSGRWVGTMGAYLPAAEPAALLVGVYVAPAYRGREAGVAEGLLSGIERWAALRCSRIELEVHEDNLRAQAFYRRRGYALTGTTRPYELNPGQRELQMARVLAPAGPLPGSPR